MKQLKELITAALNVRQRAYAPYSQYLVGAAVASADGRIFTGCNVENISYGLTCCAERNALFHAVAEGARQFQGMVVATKDGGSPCGACRQVIYELCGDIPIVMVNEAGKVVAETTSVALLPAPFESDELGAP